MNPTEHIREEMKAKLENKPSKNIVELESALFSAGILQ